MEVKNQNANYSNFVFYGSWRDTLEGFKEDFGEEYAREALWNLMLMATAGDIETDKKSIIGFVRGACMPNVEAAQDRYERAQLNGQKGGRPKVLSGVDEQTIAAWRREGYTAVQIGDMLGVNEKTVRRTNGWKEYLTYGLTDKTDKTDTKTQNPEKDIDIEKEKEKAKEKGNKPMTINEKRKQEIRQEIGIDGFIYRTQEHLRADTKEQELAALGYTPEEILYIVAELMAEE